ncbi:FecCD family ABC transporter permease [Corynebacterium renale]|uniref:Iron complex transport system permease protein n=1 Tax=Corynebacterium renale TaxID=1724 RepID=A0A2A9DNV4_9CORY|nr:iron ABC transporter permease [Corynebacterium renale]PFG28036.1 iron complex transport system permease protein [Corynebacterium renale]SQI21197.1 iron ABC transporter permease [Corynebacterium renale]STC99066.1 iron ABC transporter permease [Corynebacterium renale]
MSGNQQQVADLIAGHRTVVRKRLLIIAVLIVAAVLSFLVAAAVGAITIPLGDVLMGLIRPSTLDAETRVVLWDLRLPMAVMAVLIGMGLALAGAQMQTILSNPLAEPFTLGVSAAAAFGSAASIVAGWDFLPNPQANIALMAWLSAMIATAVIVGASVFRGASAETMILLGIALVFLFQALLALMKYRASTEALSQIVFWSMGSLTRANWMANAILAAVIAASVPVFVALSWRLTALRLGDARAAALGVNVNRLRIVVLIVVSIVAATTVAFCGIIGFVGLVGPHVARMLVGEDQRFFLPASMAAGAVMVCCSHAVSLMIRPGIAIPIGIVTAIVGVPFFIGVILTKRRALW